MTTASAGYSGTPLPQKLGIRAGSRVLLAGNPADLADLDLGPLPASAVVHRRAGRPPYDVVVALCRSRAELGRRWEALHPRTTPAGRLWVAWPKRASGVPTDLDEGVVRAHGLSHGRVDVKVCAVDATWSALAFVLRLGDR